MAEILIVREDRLDECPKRFVDYVQEYGNPRKVLGIPCLVFERHAIHPSGGGCGGYNSWRRGLAPSHSVSLMRYEKGSDGVNINEWLRKNKEKGIFESFYSTEPSYSIIDDD